MDSKSVNALRTCEIYCAPEKHLADGTKNIGSENVIVKQTNLEDKTRKRRSSVAQLKDDYDYHDKLKKTEATEKKYSHDTNKEIQTADEAKQTLDAFHEEMKPIATWRIDKCGWNKYLEEEDESEYEAMKLLGVRSLPDKEILNKIMQEKERVISPTVQRELLRSICIYIKGSSHFINDVWAGYRSKTGKPVEQKDVVFVIHTTKHIEGEWDFETYQICKDDITESCRLENEAIYKYEQTLDNFLTTEMTAIKAYIKKNARRLMQKHSNLTKISPSFVRSSGYQTKAPHMEITPCIALYVQIKGLVPFNEESFDRTITGLPFDVREGVFTLCGQPDDFHRNVKMGCQIDSGYGTVMGTVGPFVQLNDYTDTYFLTSAHVALDKQQMEALMQSDDNYIYYGKTGNNIFQPPESKTVLNSNTGVRFPLGKTVLAVCKEGFEDEAGMELALVHVNNDRLPNDGRFPESSINFSSGEILNRAELMPTTRLLKFGCSSRLTEGRYVDDCTTVRAGINGIHVTLNNQIEIKSLDPAHPFGKAGDSGSLVFADDNGECRAVGIFEGKMNEHTFMVTPIEDAVNFVGNRLSYHRNDICQSGEKLQFAVKLPFERHPVLGNQTCNMASIITQNVEHSVDTVKNELRDTRNIFKEYLDNRFDHLESLLINSAAQN